MPYRCAGELHFGLHDYSQHILRAVAWNGPGLLVLLQELDEQVQPLKGTLRRGCVL